MNETGQILQQLAVGVRLNDVPEAANGPPSIAVTGTTAFTATNQAGVDAFDNVTISDAEASDTITLTITFNATDGSLVGLNGQAIPTPTTSGNNKVYTFTGTKAALTSALHDIQFDPADRAAGGGAVVTTLTIGVSDPDHTTPVTNSQITVSSTPPAAVNSAPAGLSQAMVSSWNTLRREQISECLTPSIRTAMLSPISFSTMQASASRPAASWPR